MPDRREDLPITGTETDEDLKPAFTYEELQKELWADIDAVFSVPPRMPGDIDCRQIMEHYGLTETGARSRMAQLVHSGNWEYLTVQDDMSANGKRKVVRKVK